MSTAIDTAHHVIVVGVDGSEGSKAALLWGARQAELTGSSLEAVMSWSVPVMAYGAAMPLPYDLDLDASSRRALDQVIVETLGADPEVKIVSTVVEGQAAVELVRAAQGADLLVVGSRGHSAFAGMLLGSVSEHCAAHAPCPVVVVRAPEHPGA